MAITYRDAGVDVDKAEFLIKRCKKEITSTFNPFVLNPIGGFASLASVPPGFKEPVIVTSTDGVGTKLKIAFISGRHDTVGIDLVAMCANDILTFGAKPYFFLDYFACGKLEERIFEDVIKGICEGCRQAGCALVGGETAEMPGFYGEKEYDLAGFIVGFVEKERIIDGSAIREGDVIVGLSSSGLHSNGFSLARKIFFDLHKFSPVERLRGTEGSISEILLRPTRIYARPVLSLLEHFSIHGMSHITGGGLPGNIERIIPDGLQAEIEIEKEWIPTIFKIIMELGPVSIEEMVRTFNMGIGFVLIVKENDVNSLIVRLEEMGESSHIIGTVRKSNGKGKVSIRIL